MNNDRSEIIEKVINDGHLIANKIRNASSISDINDLSDEIEKYYSFVNENVGEVDELSENEELYSQLSFYLSMAIETKERHLAYPHEEIKDYGNEDVDTFEEYLDSKEWLKNSAG